MINSTKFSRAAVCFREHNSAFLPSRGLLGARNRCGRTSPPSGALSAPGKSTRAPEIIPRDCSKIPCDCSKLVIVVCHRLSKIMRSKVTHSPARSKEIFPASCINILERNLPYIYISLTYFIHAHVRRVI